MAVKSLVRTASRALLTPKPALLIGGLGRCGTTLVFDAILKSNYTYSKGRTFVVDILTFPFERSYVYKTHDYAPSELKSHVRVLFMFGNPMNAAISGSRVFDQRHYVHVKSQYYCQHDKIFDQDVLLMEAHFEFVDAPSNV